MKKIVFLFLLFTIGVTQISLAQNQTITKSAEIQTINNQKFYIHTVQAKETLYAISKVYGVDANKIIEYNPTISGGLTIGETIKIPVVSTESSAQQAPVEVSKAKSKETIKLNDTIFYIHTIQPGQTLYLLSKIYNTTTAAILQANYGLTESLPVNQRIQIKCVECKVETKPKVVVATQPIPIEEKIAEQPNQTITQSETVTPKEADISTPDKINEQVTTEAADEIEENTAQYSPPVLGVTKSNVTTQPIRIALLLPFYLDLNSAQTTDGVILNKEKDIYAGTFPFLEYYEGVLMAIDSLKKLGISVDLKVYDTNKDTTTIRATLAKINPSKTDLIIGPVFSENFPIVAGYAKRHKIPIVSPLSSEDIPLYTNPYVIQVNCPQKYRHQELAKFASQYKNCNVILVYNSETLEKQDVTECKNFFNTTYLDSVKKNQIIIKEIFFPKLGLAGIENAMSPTKKNIIIVLSKNQAFINNIVTKLFQYSKKYDIHLYGMPVWERYENLELDFLFDLQFQFTANGYIDYSNATVTKFVSDYRQTFKTDPTKFCFQGFDQMLYFANVLTIDKANFLEYIVNNPITGLYDTYTFIKPTANSGIINRSVKMIQYTKTYERRLLKIGM